MVKIAVRRFYGVAETVSEDYRWQRQPANKHPNTACLVNVHHVNVTAASSAEKVD